MDTRGFMFWLFYLSVPKKKTCYVESLVGSKAVVDMATFTSVSFSLLMEIVIVKAIPVTGRGGPQGCETLRFPHTS
jgi:hypothetical protein